MEREWKVGDRFTLELEVIEVDCKDRNTPILATAVGTNESAWFSKDEILHAKPIQSAAPEPKKLDTSKRVRIKWSGDNGRIVGETFDKTQLVFEYDRGGVCIAPESEFENIPEPKIIGRRLAVLVEDESIYWGDNSPDSIYRLGRYLHVIGRAWVEITEGDGMEKS